MLPSRVLFVADAAQGPGPAWLARAAAAGGIRFVEVRWASGPGPGSEARLAELREAREALPGITLLVNDRVDLALLCGAEGAHVGQGDLPAAPARALLGPGRLLGLSTHGEEQLRRAQDLPLDYVALGPIFASRTKSGHAEPLGLATLRTLRRLSRLPLVAIGGIGLGQAAAVIEAGADCIAVASAISLGASGTCGRPEDVAGRARDLLEAAGEQP